MYDNTLTVLSFAVNKSEDDDDCFPDPTTLQPNMPAEIDLCGVLFIGEGEEPIPTAFKVEISLHQRHLVFQVFFKIPFSKFMQLSGFFDFQKS